MLLQKTGIFMKKRVPFPFPDLKHSQMKLNKKDHLFFSGEFKDKVYWLEKGFVQLFTSDADGQDSYLKIYTPGEWIFSHEVHVGVKEFHYGIALSSVFLSSVSKTAFSEMLHDSETFQKTYVRQMEKDLVHYKEKIIGLSREDTEYRLQKLMQDLFKIFQSSEDHTVEIPFLKKDLAKMIHTTPETLSRILAKWREKDLLRVRRRVWEYHRDFMEEEKG